MKPALSTPDDLQRALGFIDNAVRDGRWAEARKWIRVFVPAIELISLNENIGHPSAANGETTQDWFELMKSGTELGRSLVREEKRAYTAQMAEVVARLNKVSRG